MGDNILRTNMYLSFKINDTPYESEILYDDSDFYVEKDGNKIPISLKIASDNKVAFDSFINDIDDISDVIMSGIPNSTFNIVDDYINHLRALQFNQALLHLLA